MNFDNQLQPVDQSRMASLRDSLRPHIEWFKTRKVLDFGCGNGLSSVVLVEMGADAVVGAEPDEQRVVLGREMLVQSGIHNVELHHVPNTLQLPFAGDSFGFILANAVLEHIPQSRTAYIRELWRVLAPGGVLLINETPNKYLPADFHTLHLPLTNWLPSTFAHWIGVTTGRFDRRRTDWATSGWRGLGYFELVGSIPGPYLPLHEQTRLRQRVLLRVGLPSGLLDPYPTYMLRKPIA